jgi:hypothetical protein
MNSDQVSAGIADHVLIGWREWIGLPQLGIPRIKAKIDTGARTSVLHAFHVQPYQKNAKHKVKFSIHPRQYSTTKTIICDTELLDVRWITDSGGHKEKRCVIQTSLLLGEREELIEISLTCRDDMRFRMLLGRTALKNNLLVKPSASYLLGKRK